MTLGWWKFYNKGYLNIFDFLFQNSNHTVVGKLLKFVFVAKAKIHQLRNYSEII